MSVGLLDGDITSQITSQLTDAYNYIEDGRSRHRRSSEIPEDEKPKSSKDSLTPSAAQKEENPAKDKENKSFLEDLDKMFVDFSDSDWNPLRLVSALVKQDLKEFSIPLNRNKEAVDEKAQSAVMAPPEVNETVDPTTHPLMNGRAMLTCEQETAMKTLSLAAANAAYEQRMKMDKSTAVATYSEYINEVVVLIDKRLKEMEASLERKAKVCDFFEKFEPKLDKIIPVIHKFVVKLDILLSFIDKKLETVISGMTGILQSSGDMSAMVTRAAQALQATFKTPPFKELLLEFPSLGKVSEMIDKLGEAADMLADFDKQRLELIDEAHDYVTGFIEDTKAKVKKKLTERWRKRDDEEVQRQGQSAKRQAWQEAGEVPGASKESAKANPESACPDHLLATAE